MLGELSRRAGWIWKYWENAGIAWILAVFFAGHFVFERIDICEEFGRERK